MSLFTFTSFSLQEEAKLIIDRQSKNGRSVLGFIFLKTPAVAAEQRFWLKPVACYPPVNEKQHHYTPFRYFCKFDRSPKEFAVICAVASPGTLPQQKRPGKKACAKERSRKKILA